MWYKRNVAAFSNGLDALRSVAGLRATRGYRAFSARRQSC
jgi:hypothetical protein